VNLRFLAGHAAILRGAVAIWVAIAPSSAAMEIAVIETPGGLPTLSLKGEIELGDTENLLTWLAQMRNRDKKPLLLLDSPGGSLLEALTLATLIHTTGASAVVMSGDVCASACFLLFAASPSRYASSDALIGVHSVSLYGDENVFTLDLTTRMARAASEFGVPPGVIGRMVTTKPSEMAWLTRDELKDMGVHFLRSESIGSSAIPPAEPVGVASSTGNDDVADPDIAVRMHVPDASKANDDPNNRLAYRPANLASAGIPRLRANTNDSELIKPEGVPAHHKSNRPATQPARPILLYQPG
jgi:hypothetical protein